MNIPIRLLYARAHVPPHSTPLHSSHHPNIWLPCCILFCIFASCQCIRYFFNFLLWRCQMPVEYTRKRVTVMHANCAGTNAFTPQNITACCQPLQRVQPPFSMRGLIHPFILVLILKSIYCMFPQRKRATVHEEWRLSWWPVVWRSWGR